MKYLYSLLLLVLFTGCKGQTPNQSVEQKQINPVFKMISIPDMITEPMERADYLIKHYWDNFDFSNPNWLQQPDVIEQSLVDYLDVMRLVSYETASSSIKGMLGKAEQDSSMFVMFTDLYEKYLYDPNSPMRFEEYYIPVLEVIMGSPLVSDVNKIRPAHRLELALKNRVGRPATDFTYTLPNGQKRKLYDLKGEFILLYFYNPGCTTCKEVAAQIQGSPVIDQYLKSKQLTILAIYPDEDLTEFKSHLAQIPKDWINSYDEGARIKEEDIYDLKAIPTLYLLDRDKNVLLKDVNFGELEYFLQQVTQ